MKVLIFNGSPHPHGTTAQALQTVAQTLQAQGLTTEILNLGTQPLRDCTACNGCVGKSACVYADDVVNLWLQKAQTADAFVFGSPVYFAHPTGSFLAALDRMFYAGGQFFAHKPAAVVTCARRAGTVASLDVLNKYLTINQMPVVASTYWNQTYRTAPGKPDMEGQQTLRHLAENLAWLLKCLAAGRAQGLLPPSHTKTVKTDWEHR